MPLVECVPNFSEGRRPDVVQAIQAAIASAEGVTVVGCEMDADHNRAVVTLLGEVEAVKEGAFRGIAKATELIDLREHEGAHPRMGATDVVPFVPLGDTPMQVCVDAAQDLARRVGDELSIPVYLYENAAVREGRRGLAKIRKGQFEKLSELIGTDPDREPDHGPHAIHESAGATAIGARFFLVAYNVNLASNDVALAKEIGKTIREKNGGLPGVKSMGFHLEERDLAQVSMNLVDYRKTSPGAAFEEIRRLAGAKGVEILESEVIGLIPQAAITQSFVDMTKPAGWTGEEVIESRLPKPDALSSAGPFLDALSSAAPTPGGGSAAALVGAAGAALVAMVTNLTIGRKKYAEVEDEMRALRTQSLALQRSMDALVRRDAEAYAGFMVAMKLPKETGADKAARKDAMAAAAVVAAEVPLETMRQAVAVMELAVTAAAKGNRNAASDGGVGALLARAALRAADLNVRINLPSVKDEELRVRLADEAAALSARAETLENDALAATGLL